MKKRALIYIILLCVLHRISYGQVRVVFRFDDIILSNESFNDSLLNVFAKNRIPINLGIVPFDENNSLYLTDSIRIQQLKGWLKDGTIDIQLHGYNHQHNGADNSEFRGLDLSEQYYRIRKGKYVLDSLFDTNISIFIPPWNTYDHLTLKVLDSLNFKSISADKWGNYASDKLSYIPCTYEGFDHIGSILKNNRDPNALMVILMHQYAFDGYEASYPVQKINFEQLDSILGWFQSNGITCTTFSELTDRFPGLDVNRYTANTRHANSVSAYISKRLYLPIVQNQMYYSISYLNRLYVFDCIIWTLSFLFVFGSVFALFGVNKWQPKFNVAAVIVTCIVLVTAYIRRSYSMEWMIISNGLIFITVSLLVVVLFFYKHQIGKRQKDA